MYIFFSLNMIQCWQIQPIEILSENDLTFLKLRTQSSSLLKTICLHHQSYCFWKNMNFYSEETLKFYSDIIFFISLKIYYLSITLNVFDMTSWICLFMSAKSCLCIACEIHVYILVLKTSLEYLKKKKKNWTFSLEKELNHTMFYK